MLIEMGLVGLFLATLLIIVLVALFFWGMKHALLLGLNSVLGFFSLYAVKVWVFESLAINMWSVLAVGVFGIFGLIFVVLVHWLGFAFIEPPGIA